MFHFNGKTVEIGKFTKISEMRWKLLSRYIRPTNADVLYGNYSVIS